MLHCQRTIRGELIPALDLVDVATGWSESVPIPGRGQKATLEATDRIRMRLPFPLLGLRSGN